MDRVLRFGLLFACILYFSVCIAASLEINYVLHEMIISFFILFGVVVCLRYLILMVGAVRDKAKETDGVDPSWRPFVSIIMPAYNEESLVEAALTSLAKLEYPCYEIIVIDDGSTDGTALIATKVAGRQPDRKITIISQTNSGKAWALNTGIRHAQGEIVVCVDSDSRLNPDALNIGLRHFRDERLGAIGGFVDIINTNKLITRLQQLEYIIGLNFIRRGLSYFNMVTVIPGPIGMFRKEALHQVGGYNTSNNCFAEDADLTVRLLANGWHVRGETRMLAHTEAPDTLYRLLRQRYRWKRGIFQAWSENVFDLITLPDRKGIVIAGILMFESFLFDVINFGITLFALSSFLVFGEFKIFLWAFIVLTVLDLSVFVFSSIERGWLLNMLWLFIVSKISYAYILQAWGVFALFDEWLSTKMSWDKLERHGDINLK